MSSFPTPLLQGYAAFKGDTFADQRKRYATLAEQGQTPESLIIACCDSRAAPETIFNSGPGEIFVIRNVANVVPPYAPDGEYHGTSAALEFAVQALKVKNIVVLGHARCGGIKAALSPGGEPLSPGDFIGKWIDLVEAAAREVAADDSLSDEERQTALERLSVGHSLDNLRTFPYVRSLEEQGQLSLHGAWFDIFNGELWLRDPDSGAFSPAASD